MHQQFQFIAVSNPTGSLPFELRKLTHSHAIRQVHANQRRLRTQKYQREVMQSKSGQHPVAHEQAHMIYLNRVFYNGKDVFSVLPRPLSSQECFLLDHYVQVVVPYCTLRSGLFDTSEEHQQQVLRDWLGLAITDKDLLDAAILLSACRSVLRSRPGDPVFTQMMLQYRQRGLQMLLKAVRSLPSQLNTLTIAKVLALAFDEVSSGEVATAEQHIQGLFAMIEIRGGAQSLGLTGLIEQMYCRFINKRGLRDANKAVLCGSTSMTHPVIEPVHQ